MSSITSLSIKDAFTGHVNRYEAFEKPENITDESLRLSYIMGCFPPLITSSPSNNTALLELKKRKENFVDVLPEVIDSFINNFNFKGRTDIPCWIKQVFDYNLNGGKLLRGMSTVMAYEAFEKPENITDESLRLSYIMGWCVEMLQAYGLVIDDIMDGSVQRRGLPCWYTLPSVGLRAINDGVLIFTAINYTLRSNFGHLPQYLDLMDRINDVMVFSTAGQYLDHAMTHRDKSDYSKFTLETYNAIANYKTSYSFMLGICLGMLLANNNNKQRHHKVEEICLKMGCLFQMQDDFIDVFELESVTGKVGTDIQEGKCTWLAVTALQQCNVTQREEFVSCYGSPDPGDVERIKRLYHDLKLPEIYREEERRRHDEVVLLVNSCDFDDSARVTALFMKLLYFINNRNK